ncbi:MAG: hypothetical protein ACTSYI_00220 [Promethearchaeota archaeon]
MIDITEIRARMEPISRKGRKNLQFIDQENGIKEFDFHQKGEPKTSDYFITKTESKYKFGIVDEACFGFVNSLNVAIYRIIEFMGEYGHVKDIFLLDPPKNPQSITISQHLWNKIVNK